MPTLRANFFDGRTSRKTEALLWREGDVLRITGSDLDIRHSVRSLLVAPALGSAPRRIYLSDGAFCEVSANRELERLLDIARPDLVTRLERTWTHALGALALSLMIIVGGYMWGLPWAAKHAAMLVPAHWCQELGAATLEMLDATHATPSTVPAERQTALLQQFASLRISMDNPLPWTIHFRNLNGVANAFALPSGDIVLTDAFVLGARNDGEILAVLCHEIGHVAMRHSLRILFQSLGVSLTVAALTGDFSDLASHASGLLELTYSRDMEREADQYAIGMLKANDRSPALLADALETLRTVASSSDTPATLPALFSTHPDIRERIAQARSAR